MRKMKLLYPVAFLLVLVCALLSGCGDDDDRGDERPAGAVDMNPITGANSEGNIQVGIGGVTISSPPVVTFAMSDENGQPLDPREVLNDTSARLRFYIARLDDKGRYLNYIPNASGNAPSYDSNQDAASIKNRIAEVRPGVYTYTFVTDIKDSSSTFQHFTSNSNLGAKRRTTFDPTKTHTVVIQVLRNTVKNGKPFRQTANPYFNFRPDGAPVTQTREIVAISNCNQCHGKLAVHGGSRIDIPLCIVCHTVGVSANGSGNTASIDLKMMVHAIHMGKALPSKAYFETPAFRGYSTLTYPVFSADPVAHTVPIDCVKCHRVGTDISGRSFGKDVDRNKVATRTNCTSCHNTTSFGGQTTLTVAGVPGVPADPHSAGPQNDDSRCANVGCHPATGADYSTNSVTGAHAVWEKSPANPRLVARVLSATNVGPGKYPRVVFQLTDGAGNPASPDPGTVTPSQAGTNNLLVFRNSVEIHVAIKPRNIPDFLNEKLASDDPLNRFPVLTQTNGGGGSTSVVSANAAARSGRLGTVDLGRGIFFVNFSTAQTTPASFTAATPTLTERPNKLPSLTGDFVNGATIAFAVQASRSDVSITHRGVPTVLGLASTNPANATVPPGTPVNPVIAANMKADVYYDLASGGAVIGGDQQRRLVVEDADCRACHNVIAGVHASRRPNAESCVLCHNPNRNDENFVFLIHKLHTGEQGAIGRFRRENIAEEIEFPNQRNRCYICHVAEVPEPISSYPGYTTFNAFDTNNRIPSFSAACLACHDTQEDRGATRAHALANVVNFSYIAPTTSLEAVWNIGTVPPSRAEVERCAICHTPESRALCHQLEY